MTVSLKHAFESPITDLLEPDQVGPDEWNAEHVLTQAGERLLGKTDAGAGATQELTAAQVSAFLASGGASGDLTRTNDTNVTLTLGGTPTGALLKATSITVGWTGTLAAARGGFGSDVSGSSGVPLFAAGVPTFTSTTGSGNFARATSPALVTPDLGTPSAVVLTSATGLPVGSGISGLGAGVATFLATPSSANFASAVTGETGSGALVFATSPALVTPDLGTPSAAVLTNATGLPTAGLVDDAVTYAKIQNVSAASKLVGRGDSGAGDPQEITLGSGLSMSGTTLTASAASPFGPPQGRLTLTTGVPVMIATATAQTTIYYTPYIGYQAPIYDGSNWTMTTFAELSQATTDATKSPAAVANNSVYDLFVWNDSGTIRCTRGPAWTNDTTRSAGTALVRVNGIWLNNASITNGPAASRGTYVGTVRSNGSAQIDYIFGATAAGGTAGFFGVWNAYNRRKTRTKVIDSTDSWSVATNTIQSRNASAANRATFVIGLQEDWVSARGITTVNSGSATNPGIGIGYDSTTAISGLCGLTSGGGGFGPCTSEDAQQPLGVHYFQALDVNSGANTSTIYGDNALPLYNQGGLIVELWN